MVVGVKYWGRKEEKDSEQGILERGFSKARDYRWGVYWNVESGHLE